MPMIANSTAARSRRPSIHAAIRTAIKSPTHPVTPQSSAAARRPRQSRNRQRMAMWRGQPASQSFQCIRCERHIPSGRCSPRHVRQSVSHGLRSLVARTDPRLIQHPVSHCSGILHRCAASLPVLHGCGRYIVKFREFAHHNRLRRKANVIRGDSCHFVCQRDR